VLLHLLHRQQISVLERIVMMELHVLLILAIKHLETVSIAQVMIDVTTKINAQLIDVPQLDVNTPLLYVMTEMHAPTIFVMEEPELVSIPQRLALLQIFALLLLVIMQEDVF
jgi:hypothetical protein